MRNAIIVLILFSAGLTTFAQKNFSEGYIITLTNDTITGKVKDYCPPRFLYAPKKITFIDSTGVEKVYIPNELSGYSKASIANYLSIDLGYGKNFARVKIGGYITLLSIKANVPSTAFIPNVNIGTTTTYGGSSETETFYLYNKNKQDSSTIKVSKYRFKDWAANFFSDYPELKEMILNMELRYDDIEIIVEKYNKWKKQQIPL